MLFAIERRLLLLGVRFARQFCSEMPDYKPNSPARGALQRDDRINNHAEETKSLKIAITGSPNAGKSTLINYLTNRSMCATSTKVHTTQTKSNSVVTIDDTQLIFVDTPGLLTKSEQKKYKLKDSFQDDPNKSINAADVVVFVQDASNQFTRTKITDSILNLLQKVKPNIPQILILNKIDTVRKKHVLLPLIKTLTGKDGWPNFSEVFLVSAITGEGIEELKNYFVRTAKPRDWEYAKDTYTDQEPGKVIEQIVRAKLLDGLPEEMPYKMQVQLEYFEVNPDGSIKVVVEIDCWKERIRRYLLRGTKLKYMAEKAEEDLRNAFRTHVILRLNVTIRNSSE